MNTTATRLLWLIAACCLAALALQAVILMRAVPSGPSADKALEERLALAGRLRTQGLGAEALAEYEAALRIDAVAAEKKANIAYLAGNIAYEDLRDSQRALALYQRSLFYNPEPEKSLKRKMAERVAECQERLGRSLDASQTLANATYLTGQDTRARKGAVAAKIGERQITLGEIDQAIQRFPESVQKQFADPAAKRDFARSYVAQELLAEKAKRLGLERDPEVLQSQAEAERSILIQHLLRREVSNKVSIQPSDVELYFQGHQEQFQTPRRVRAAHILLADQSGADEARRRLDNGEDFAALAREISLDEATREKGGELGWVVDRAPFRVPGLKGDSEPAARAILALNEAQVSSPVSAQAGFHVFKALEVRPAESMPLEQARPMVEGLLRRQREQELEQKMIEELMAAEKVQIYDDAFGPAQPASAPAKEAGENGQDEL